MQKKSSLVLLVSALLLAMLVVVGCGNDSTEKKDESTGGATPAATVVQAGPGAREGGQVPDFQLKRIDGTTLQLSSLQGKAVLVDFWDTWCPPCVAALPHLEEISNAYKDDLVVVGVAFGRQGEAAVAKFIQDKGLTFEFVLADQKVIRDFGGLQSIPTTFLVDRNGLIIKKWVGGQSKQAYESAVKAVVES